MLLIPILSALLQFLQTKLSMAVQKSGDDKKKNATPGAMEGMLKIMPIISGIFCVIFPIGVGLYWVINSAVSIVQQYFINKRLDKISIDDIVAANEAKEAERMKKLGIVSNSNTTSNIARTNTKTISAIAANNNSSNKGKNSDDRKLPRRFPTVRRMSCLRMPQKENPTFQPSQTFSGAMMRRTNNYGSERIFR